MIDLNYHLVTEAGHAPPPSEGRGWCHRRETEFDRCG